MVLEDSVQFHVGITLAGPISESAFTHRITIDRTFKGLFPEVFVRSRVLRRGGELVQTFCVKTKRSLDWLSKSDTWDIKRILISNKKLPSRTFLGTNDESVLRVAELTQVDKPKIV